MEGEDKQGCYFPEQQNDKWATGVALVVIKLTPANNGEGTFTLCMEPAASGTSEATLGTFQNCLLELCDIAVKGGIATHDKARDPYSFSNIVGKMLDTASTKTKHTKLLVEEKAHQLKEKGSQRKT